MYSIPITERRVGSIPSFGRTDDTMGLGPPPHAFRALMTKRPGRRVCLLNRSLLTQNGREADPKDLRLYPDVWIPRWTPA